MAGTILRQVEWVQVAGKWTKMSVMGTNLSVENLRLPSRKHEDDRIVILMMPGNPGNEAFYTHFGKQILENLMMRDEEIAEKTHSLEQVRTHQYLFYTVSSLNHVRMPDEFNGRDGHFNSDRFSLEEQVTHKLNFVKEHLPRGKKVYIFGHSIGSYMMLRILPEVIREGFNVEKAVALFPTIEHMATSPNGRRLQSTLATLNNYDRVTKCLTFWVDYLPEALKRWIIGFNLRSETTPKEVVEAAVELVHMDVFRNIVHMSNDELDMVVDLDENLLSNSDIVHFYYGLKDGWCPVQNGYSMLERLGSKHVTLDEDNCEHAFVITEGEIMAKNVMKYFEE